MTSVHLPGLDGSVLLCLDQGAASASLYLEVSNVLTGVQVSAQTMLNLAEALTDAAGRCGNEADLSQVEIDLILP